MNLDDERLKKPTQQFVRLPEYLDAYIADIQTYPRDKVVDDYEFLKSFYFDHNTDPVREKAFVSYLEGALSTSRNR